MVMSVIMGWTVAERQQSQKIIIRALSITLAVAAYAYTLHWVYLNLITDLFTYLGYTYREPYFYTTAFTFIAAVISAMCLPSRLKKPSDFILWVLFIVAVVPAIFIPTYATYQSDEKAMASGIGFAAAFILATAIARRNPRKPIRPLIRPVSSSTFWLVVSAYTLAAYVLIHLTLGLSINFIGLLEVYEQRDEYRQGLAGTSALIGYVVSTQANVVNPLIIARGIYTRRWWIVGVGILGQMVLYSGTGFKTILFSVPTIFVFAWLMRKGKPTRTIWFLWGAIAVAVVAAIVDEAQGGILWTSLFSRRFLITPGILSAAYMQFYDTHPYALLSHSVFEGLTRDHYSGQTPARVVGYWMTMDESHAANANLFADGYANFGALGVAGAAIILGIYLRLIDRVTIGLPVAVSALVVVMPAVALSNTSILTAMLSHGLAVTLLVLAFAPRSGWLVHPKKIKRRQARAGQHRPGPSSAHAQAEKRPQ